MYKIVRFFLFLFDPEKIHYKTASLIKFALSIPGMKAIWKALYTVEDKRLGKELFGIKFKNPVGLAAGFDKNATMYNNLAHCGFGFIEIGTLTPRPQEGNPKPRLFRVSEDKALINRMGFNNEGVDEAVQKIKANNPEIILGGNIGKNTLSKDDQVIDDFKYSFNALHDVVDYFTVNVSCPNIGESKALKDQDSITEILNELEKLNKNKEVKKPILLKIAPDLDQKQLDEVVEIVEQTNIDGLIATNTTTRRDLLKNADKEKVKAIGNGGLSGAPLREQSTEVIKYLRSKLPKAFPIIGVGGIHSAEDAIEKLEAGADLVQVYTGFVYEGPKLIKRINKGILRRQ